MFEGLTAFEIVKWILGILGVGASGGAIGYWIKFKELNTNTRKNYREELRADVDRLMLRIEKAEEAEDQMRSRFFELEQEHYQLKLEYQSSLNRIEILTKEVDRLTRKLKEKGDQDG